MITAASPRVGNSHWRAASRRAASAATGVALVAALSACGGSAEGGQTSTTPAAVSSATSSAVASLAPGTAADVTFAQYMIPHHEQAVAMANMALVPSAGASPAVQELASQIKSAQAPEIAQMTTWLNAWGQPTAMPSASSGGADAMAGMDHGGVDSAGMMSAQDMEMLQSSSGAQFDKLWLTLMIAHHRGAVAMAQDVLATSTNPQVRAMAQAIIDTQNAEIARMEAMLFD